MPFCRGRTHSYDAVILNMNSIFILVDPHIPTDRFPSAVRTMPPRFKPLYALRPGLSLETKIPSQLRKKGTGFPIIRPVQSEARTETD